MSFIRTDDIDFVEESIDGMLAAHPALLRKVPGGVARRSAPAQRVAVVIGGGSGHYPAFAGLVGPGLADAAAMGNVFASPSAHQVYGSAKAVATSAGVLLSYGNYAGDVLNFDQAQARLIDDGIACRTVVVTDDIFSAPPAERHRRRGIAGDLVVFRAAAWAAERGRNLDEVHEFASRANERTRSLGVAFSGCTLPGADSALFTVEPGQMAVGMGIHGEPGIETRPAPTASELADLFVDKLLTETPEGADNRVGLILNGLGAVKHEELFVVFNAVMLRLAAIGLEVIDPDVGEYATSFEMAGISLTLVWLDDELEQAWRSPAYTPAYRKGNLALPDDTVAAIDDDELGIIFATGGDESRGAAKTVAAAITAIRDVIDAEVDELGRLDAVAGDGDHGIGMQRGARAAAEMAADALAAGCGAGSVLQHAGDAWAFRAGGTSGALWGAGLRAVGEHIGDETAPTAQHTVTAITKALNAVLRYGKAEVGDKTLVDAFVPFVKALTDGVARGAQLGEAWREAAAVATTAAVATASLLPRIGRARPHAEKSIGTPDPGAISLAHTMTAVATVLASNNGE